jgi:hypothetical protein
VTTPATRPGRDVECAHRAVLAQRNAARLQCARDCRYRLERLGAAVAGGVHATGPLPWFVFHQRVHFGAGEHPCIELMSLGDAQPSLEAGQLAFGSSRIEDAAAREADVCTDLARDRFPEIHAVHGDGYFCGIAALLANPTPVAAGLFAGNTAFVANQHRRTSLAEEPRGRDADDAGADHHDVDGRRQRILKRDRCAIGEVGHAAPAALVTCDGKGSAWRRSAASASNRARSSRRVSADQIGKLTEKIRRVSRPAARSRSVLRAT